MPPWIDSPEEAAVILGGALGVLATVAAGIIGVIAAAIVAWRSKVKPLLTGTQLAATHAAEQLTPNHGSTVRDSVGRIENTIDRLDRSVNARIGEVRADMRVHVDSSDRAHSEIFRRLHQIETPPEDTRP